MAADALNACTQDLLAMLFLRIPQQRAFQWREKRVQTWSPSSSSCSVLVDSSSTSSSSSSDDSSSSSSVPGCTGVTVLTLWSTETLMELGTAPCTGTGAETGVGAVPTSFLLAASDAAGSSRLLR